MKKELFLFATAATMLTACVNTDTLDKDINVQNDAIAFTNYAQPATKATENNTKTYAWTLEAHHTSFIVSGWRTVNGTDLQVFDDETVTWQDKDNDNVADAWDYSPHRFWDKRASKYTFYAAAPDVVVSQSHKWILNNNTDGPSDNSAYTDDTWYYTYSGFTLTDHDATTSDVSSDADNYVQSFATAAPDKDLMIAEKCEWTAIGTTVSLNFIHVLSRLNVIAQRGGNLSADDVVKIQEFEVTGFSEGGDFRENIRNADKTTTKTASRWENLSSTKISYTTTTTLINPNNTPATELTVLYDPSADITETGSDDMKQYILQSLVIPQDITYEDIRLIDGKQTAASTTDAAQAYLHIKYTITNNNWTGAKTEEFEGYYNLASAFGATSASPTITFNEGWQNNLTLVINPGVINFVPKVSEWDNQDFTYEIK